MPDNDDKIRMRCTGCGKRVKFPRGSAGQTFRCPKCHKTMVAPLDDDDGEIPSPSELKSVALAAARAARPRYDPSKAIRRPSLDRTRQEDRTPNLLNSIERVNAFLNRQAETIGPMCRSALTDQSLSQEERIAEVRRLRSVKAVNLRKFVDAIKTDLNKAIEKLKANPAAETETIAEKLGQLVTERECLTQYVQVMFALRPVAQEMPAPTATPDTPATGAKPPSSVSPQAPQDRPDTKNGDSKPAGTAPENNSPPP